MRKCIFPDVAGLDWERIFSKRTGHIITSTDPYKGLITLSDHPRGLEVGPPIHKWRLQLGSVAAPVNLLLRTDACDAHNTLHRQPLDGPSWRLGMNTVIESWEKTHHKSNRSGGSKYDPIVAFTGGLGGYTGQNSVSSSVCTERIVRIYTTTWYYSELSFWWSTA